MSHGLAFLYVHTEPVPHIFIFFLRSSAVPTVLWWQCKISLVFIIIVVVIFFSVCRLPRPFGPLPRIPSHCQGSNPSLGPWRPACQCVRGQGVVPLPKQLPSATQVSVLQWQRFNCGAFPLCWFTNSLGHFISSWQLHFIQSEFKGQLPQPFASGPLPTQIIPAHMNDQNLEEPTRYVSHRHVALLVAALNSSSYWICTFLFFFKILSVFVFLMKMVQYSPRPGGFTPVPLFGGLGHRRRDATGASLLSQQGRVERHRL